MRDVIRQKLADALAFKPPAFTRRDARVPAIPNKAHAVVGMRRAGKTTFLFQILADRLAQGAPRESLIYFNFEDERLAGMQAGQLGWVLEEYFARFPQFRDQRKVAFFFDEPQVVPGWESFIRRVLDTEKVDLYISGSSAKLLSREIATAMRGRATETVIYPFSFREFLRHRQFEVPSKPDFVSKAERSKLERAFKEFARIGGFPEAQGVNDQDRIDLLQGYVDVVLFRDVVERHAITNVPALRRLVRQLLSSPAGRFSVHRIYNDLRSQGVAIAKDALHRMLDHIEDAFLVKLLPLATASERVRQSNPRKAYPIDAGLIGAFDHSGKSNIGHALETMVMVELHRREFECGYLATDDGYEVDFSCTDRSGKHWLIQVCADLSDKDVRAREFRALHAELKTRPKARGLLLTSTTTDALIAQPEAPSRVHVQPAWEWLLQDGETVASSVHRKKASKR